MIYKPETLPSPRSRHYKLDVAANLYPAIRSRKRPGIFRVSADLTQPIDRDLLQKSLDQVLKRIPSFAVKLHAGLFWHYFSESKDRIRVKDDVINPCMHITPQNNQNYLIRVRHHHNRIALETFHSITDGTGAMRFLKTLVAQYLSNQGIKIPLEGGILDISKLPAPAEYEDAFKAFVAGKPGRKTQKNRSYHVKGQPLPRGRMEILTGRIPLNEIKMAAKNYQVSITEYLVALYMFVFQELQEMYTKIHKLPISIQVPVNLRQFHQTNTLRNFSGYVTPAIHPRHGYYDFEEILNLVHHFLRCEVTEKNLRAQASVNLNQATNPLVRVMPLFIKNRMIHLGYKLAGPTFYTSTISNLGLLKIPDEMVPYVKTFDFILGATRDTNVSCAVLGFQGNLKINFSSMIQEKHVERKFFTSLVRSGIPVYVENYLERN